MRSYLIAAVILFSPQLTVLGQATKSDKYVEAGIPAASREWFGSDYARAFQTLASGESPVAAIFRQSGRQTPAADDLVRELLLSPKSKYPVSNEVRGFLDARARS